jgi:hypothetical protein
MQDHQATFSPQSGNLNSVPGATIESAKTWYLAPGSALDTAPGTTRQSIDKAAGAKCSPFKEFGTWTFFTAMIQRATASAIPPKRQRGQRARHGALTTSLLNRQLDVNVITSTSNSLPMKTIRSGFP